MKMSVRTDYRHTLAAAYIGYITQAAINNFIPLLFIHFGKEFGIGLEKISFLIMVNFGVQLCVDGLGAKVIDKIGYRISIVFAHVFAVLGFVGLSFLPDLFTDHYIGLLISVIIYAIGGGLTEILVSPIAEACPTKNKSATMSLLHSFYCWGSVAVILLSTLFIYSFGIENWRILSCLWAIIPLLNAVYFTFVPIGSLTEDGKSMGIRELFRTKTFLVLILLMFCAGASELSMSQWASAFAESALGISKTLGDLLGPCMFAVCMGAARILHSRLAEKIDITKYMVMCSIICIIGYILAEFIPSPATGLIGCGVCGFAVGVMWPGTFSRSSAVCPKGGTAMFALLALAGDMGCMSGPALVGLVSDASGGDLRTGLSLSVIFPIFMIIGLIILKRLENKEKM